MDRKVVKTAWTKYGRNFFGVGYDLKEEAIGKIEISYPLLNRRACEIVVSSFNGDWNACHFPQIMGLDGARKFAESRLNQLLKLKK